jgi:hypothetical protein
MYHLRCEGEDDQNKHHHDKYKICYSKLHTDMVINHHINKSELEQTLLVFLLLFNYLNWEIHR